MQRLYSVTIQFKGTPDVDGFIYGVWGIHCHGPIYGLWVLVHDDEKQLSAFVSENSDIIVSSLQIYTGHTDEGA
jgi:hypothetical protein